MNREILDSIDIGVTDWGLDIINAPSFWDITKGEGVKVAVIDTGIDTEHPELKHAIKKTIDLRGHTGNVNDEFGHGTHVAGLIAGLNTGVAPSSELYIAKVLDDYGFGDMMNIMDGITFAINHEVDILCMSLGITRELPMAVKQRLLKAHKQGISIVCASGNRGFNGLNYPSFYDEIIAVGGIDKNLERASFSNYGKELDVVAPAVDILSTYKDGKYARLTGTSMATPLVAGGIALIKSHYRKQGIELSPIEIKNMIKKLGKKNHYVGHGVFDLEKLID
jgi:subtilisin family serine protease